MDILKRKGTSSDWRVSILLFCLVAAVGGQIRYSIPEEMRKGLFVGDVAKDLGLDVKRLVSGRARLVIDEDNQYVALNQNKGHIVVNERIDREQLCAKKSPCSFSLEIVLEDPLELFSITIEIQDVNDHAPSFPNKEINLEISESTPTGTVFLLDSAADPDVGINSLQTYSLKENRHFVLKQHTRTDGSKYAEMMLQSALDREQQSDHALILTAVDGGEPQRSGTVKIHVAVLDANDNAPVFTQSVYKASVLENVLRSTVIAKVSAVDADQGYNSNVTYYFTHLGEDSSCPFEINTYTGEVKLTGDIDYEASPNYEINLQAKDPWGVVGASKLIIDIADVNDNSPIITMASYSGKISEDSLPGTVVALISVQDKDSGKNGQINLNIDENLPFKIKSSLRNYYTLVTEQILDREKRSKYNITLTATDEGLPALSSRKTVALDVTDINDNAPTFSQRVYSTQVMENNSPGVALLQIHATDPDQGQNARISYFLIDGEVNGNPVSTYFSINTESGVIQSLRSLDFEQVKEYKIRVQAQDGGSPPLNSNTTVIVRVQDQNDNPPQVLYPVQTGGSLVAELVPRSADVGYLVTKVVAVDVDSGQNAWLSYKLQKATDRALFEVGLQNGEIRTIRQVTDKDAVKQRLTVIVEDNGQPSRSATVIVNVAVADSFPEVLSEFTDFTQDKEYNDNLTFYLVLALAVVSFLFITCLVVIISVKIYRWRQSRVMYHSNLPVIPYYPPRYSDTLGTGTLQHVYNYEVCRTTDSRKSDIKYVQPMSQSLVSVDDAGTETLQNGEQPSAVSQMSTLAQIRYSIPEEMKKGSLVGNIAQDLGLDLKRLRSGRARIVTGENIQYVELKADKGTLVVHERIDREQLCGEIADDADVGENGLQNYILSPNDNFVLKQHVNPDGSKYAEMVLQKPLDREEQPRLSLKLLAVDGGNPQRSESGVLHAVRSFDYEQIKQLVFTIKAQDGGSPPLSSNVTVKVMIQDQNDNPPQVLYPVQTGGSLVAEMVPRSADVGYLVTKVVAVDVDSGQNAWLSYRLQKATDRALFEVGLQNGEIRTIRQVTDKDAVKQRLTVIVEDNGQPSRSATVIVNVAVADSFPEVLSEFTDFTQDKEYNDNLTFYLVLALAVVSFLFITCLVVIISVKIYRWRQSRVMYHSNLPVIPYYPPRYSDTLGTGTLQHVYNYEVCRTTDSRKSDCKFGQAGSQNVLIMDPSSTGTMQRIQSERSILDEPDSPLESILQLTVQSFYGLRRQIGLLMLLFHAVNMVGGQIRYSIPEEMKKGSVIGNVAQDLGLDLRRLRSGRARIVTGESIHYTELKSDKGILVVNERIDREQLCGDVTPCSFSFEVILENPMELHRITVEVLDINDHAPVFPNKDKPIGFEIGESAAVGVQFPLQSAEDLDVGQNALQDYVLSPNENFILKQHANPDGSKYVEMVLQKPLDREQHPHLSLKLIAVDGGTPQRSGTVNIDVTVLDVNDNAPVFNQSVYKASVMENTTKGTSIITVNATDADSGSNGVITYSLSKMKGSAGNVFSIDENTGTVSVSGQIDYEKDRKYEVRVEAKDHGGLTGTSKITFDVFDVNDNAPVINIMSFSSPVSEDARPGTTVAILNIKDADSENNGQIKCSIDGKLPFKIESSLTNYYNLISDQYFDRESVSEYNITITATDMGSPPLSSSTKLHLKISDVNDNAPLFDKKSYSAYITENNSPGISIFAVSARDSDWNQNARISYILEDTQVSGSPVSTYISLNSETGVLSAVRSFDYEQIKQLQLVVKAQDGGSPPLSSNVTVKVMIQDQNDNPPQVLYPVQTGGSLVAEMVPRSADVGYLVTKVVAVDVDSGQNAWLSYKLQKATDRALFEVGLQNGEIRTIRQVTDKDAVKQRLTVIVEDNGQPSRSATVIVNVAVADSFPEVLSEFTDFTQDKEYNDNLTFYLVLALAVVSFLFITCLVVIISVKIYRWRQSRVMYHSNLPVIPYYPPRYSDTLGTGTLQHVYNYEVCRTTDSRKSDCKFGIAGSQNVLIMDPSSTGTMQRIQSEKSILDELDSPLESILQLTVQSFYGLRRQIGLLMLLFHAVNMVGGQIRYSIPEEMKKGSVIGNVAQDLGLDLRRLRSGRARIVTGESIHYTELKSDKGILVVNERIDREQLCGDVTPCSFSFEVILENPIELHRITVEVLDINDHAPVFPNKDKPIGFEISESATIGVQFPLQSAEDLDVGQNALQDYVLSPNENFILKQHANPDGRKYVEMVLQKPLDREQHPHLSLKLIAVDGGTPQRSGTVNIDVTVLDANDNVPVFNQSVYKASVIENTTKGTSIITVNATDADSGSNGLITYSLSKMKGSAGNVFSIDENTGTVSVSGQIDYEKDKKYEVRVEAKDHGGLTGTSKITFDVFDVNDNAPVINVMSFSSPVSEDSRPGTTIAVLNIKDADSENNGQIKCSIDGKLPFKIESSLTNYYNLISDQYFDRESVSEYNITITATDMGSPPLSSSTKLHLKISDVNDNAPLFDKKSYSAYITENNSPGISIFAVSARDSDWNQNARISYILEDTQVNGSPVSTYVSLNSETGVLSAVRSFDYEQIKQLQLVVKAQDGGSPPFSSNVTVKLMIQDQNDNPPQVLYPVQTGGSLVAEMVPRSADVGYLVTKVVAVDVDSGQNAWLSYRLQKATDRALFEVGLQNGEIRTIRQVTDKDAVKQRLTVIVEDNGQPSRSATVIVNVAVADSFPEVLSEFTDFTQDKEYNDNLTFYLVLALAVVSFLFITCLVVIISVKIYRWRQSRVMYHSNLPVIPYYPPRYSDTLGTGTLQHVYNYEVCRTTDSRKSDCKFGQAGSQNVLIMDPSSTGTMQRIQSERSILDELDSPLEVS
ncbi:uncharacterized protein LOC129090483 [Anoplopoma fimbria]|uniref:uncharacterized protein LOC129090483 n=1 Tax=Anoplopoma fimbria TaxID=229290 RepID=UPI0023EC090B|nr:uncharacterized protein LOC129090483 [Anoplopoma fimbria]